MQCYNNMEWSFDPGSFQIQGTAPKNTVGLFRQNVTLVCHFPGSPAIEWYTPDRLSISFNHVIYDARYHLEGDFNSQEYNLVISFVTEQDGMRYGCRVTDDTLSPAKRHEYWAELIILGKI